MSEAPASIELRGVTKRYGDSVAVHHMDLRIAKGEFFSFLGPSGCGKTTTLRMIGGFEQPTSGQILLEGRPIEGTPPYKRNVNTVFQSYALFPHMTIFDNVAFGLKMKKVPSSEISDRVLNAIETVKLKGYEKRKPGQLSGGQRQRIALARAIVNQPAVLLLDEPLGALDLKLRRQMQIELKELQTRLGITFVFVTHDQEEALTISDRIAVMSQGRIEHIGTPNDIYERPKSRFVADFIGTTNFLDATVVESTAHGLELKTDFGLPLKAAPQDIRGGTKVTLSIRPEKINLSDEPPAHGLNAMEGTIHEVIYLGTATHYIVQLPQGPRLTVFAQNGSGTVAPPGGRGRVYLSFSAGHTLALER